MRDECQFGYQHAILGHGVLWKGKNVFFKVPNVTLILILDNKTQGTSPEVTSVYECVLTEWNMCQVRIVAMISSDHVGKDWGEYVHIYPGTDYNITY